MILLILDSIGFTELFLIFFAIIIVIGIGIIFAVGIVFFKSYKRQSQMKKCPYCAEMIQPEAIVCRFCGRDLVK